MTIETLKTLYWMNSPSGNEQGISGYVRMLLNNMGVEYKVDRDHQIYNLSSLNAPLVCAHMDQVGTIPLTTLNHEGNMISGDANLGADDKNGVYIALKLIEANPGLNFIFSCNEERGGTIDQITNTEDLSSIPYGLIFDRKGGGDIIGVDNGYCSQAFQDHLEGVIQPYGYKPSVGTFSDCDELSNFINCVNLSCGYYNAHTETEYTLISEVENAIKAGQALLDSGLHETYYELGARDMEYQRWIEEYYGQAPNGQIDDGTCPLCGGTTADYCRSGDGLEGQMCLSCEWDTETHDRWGVELEEWEHGFQPVEEKWGACHYCEAPIVDGRCSSCGRVKCPYCEGEIIKNRCNICNVYLSDGPINKTGGTS